MTTRGKRHIAAQAIRRRLREAPGFARAFMALFGPFWAEKANGWARALTVALVVLTLFQVAVPILLNVWSERLFDALEQRSGERFWILVGVFVVILAANMVVSALHLAAKRRLQVRWRRWVTQRITTRWMAEGRHYQLSHMDGPHDNPDGRIAEDIRVSTEVAVDLAHSLFYCLLVLVSFTQILWTLSGTVEVAVGDLAFDLPGHLVGLALIYAVIGSWVAVRLGNPLVRAVNGRQTFEANFRFGLVHAREHAEAIALVRGEGDERRRFSDLFVGVERAWNRQTAALVNIMLFTSAYQVLATAFPVLVAAPRYMAGVITLGMLMRTAQAFQQMTSALSWPVDNLARVAEWRASVERVLALDQPLRRLEVDLNVGRGRRITVEEVARPDLAFVNLSVADPGNGLVISNLTARVAPGERVRVTGDASAAFKLFKAVTGLWPWGRGRIERPRHGEFHFMARRPYLPLGTLRAALLYPEGRHPEAGTPGGAELETALTRVGLARLIHRLEETASWDQALSVGEQQRLGFARLLLRRPDWILLHEATDSLDGEGERAMLRLIEEEFGQAGVLSVGCHAAPASFAPRTLHLEQAWSYPSAANRSGATTETLPSM